MQGSSHQADTQEAQRRKDLMSRLAPEVTDATFDLLTVITVGLAVVALFIVTRRSGR
jgi:hypothetical protein